MRKLFVINVKAILFTALSASTLLTIPAQASNPDLSNGNAFFELCNENSPESQWKLACTYYIKGMYNGIEGAMGLASVVAEKELKAGSTDFRSWCVPNKVTSTQLVDVLISYLKAHPDTRHQPTTWLFMLALRENYPSLESSCKN